MTTKKTSRSRAAASGRVTPKGVRPPGFSPRPASDGAPRPSARVLERNGARPPRRAFAGRTEHSHKGHRGGR